MSVINTNINAIAAARNLNASQEMLGRSLNRLSSGSKIVLPSDDAAGLAVSEKLGAQSQRITAAVTNVQNAESYTALYQQEFTALQDQLRATIGGTTTDIGGTVGVTTPLGAFNGIELFGSTAAGGLTVTIGQAVGQQMTITDTNLRNSFMAKTIMQDTAGAYTLNINSSSAIGDITNAIQHVATERASLGAAESRLQLAATTLQVEFENLGSAISRIKDVDVATESTQYAKYNILVQSGTAMLAQANQTPKTVLQLLQNP